MTTLQMPPTRYRPTIHYPHRNMEPLTTPTQHRDSAEQIIVNYVQRLAHKPNFRVFGDRTAGYLVLTDDGRKFRVQVDTL